MKSHYSQKAELREFYNKMSNIHADIYTIRIKIFREILKQEKLQFTLMRYKCYCYRNNKRI